MTVDVQPRIDVATAIAIQALVTEHSYLVDHGEADLVADLYTGDGELIGLPPRNLIGADQIREWGRGRVRLVTRTSRHIESNLRLTWLDDELHGTLSVMMFRSDTPDLTNTTPSMVGEYLDTYSLQDDGWRIRRREIRRVFAATSLAPQPDSAGTPARLPRVVINTVTLDDH